MRRGLHRALRAPLWHRQGKTFCHAWDMKCNWVKCDERGQRVMSSLISARFLSADSSLTRKAYIWQLLGHIKRLLVQRPCWRAWPQGRVCGTLPAAIIIWAFFDKQVEEEDLGAAKHEPQCLAFITKPAFVGRVWKHFRGIEINFKLKLKSQQTFRKKVQFCPQTTILINAQFPTVCYLKNDKKESNESS